MRSVMLAAAVTVAAALLWLLRPVAPPPIMPPATTTSSPSSAATTTATPRVDTADRRTAVPDERTSTIAAPAGDQLRLRLIGLHAATPWTAALQIELHATRRDGVQVQRTGKVTPDAEGRGSLPCDDDLVAIRELRVWADDRRYLPLRERRPGPVSLAQEIELGVFRASVLTGRITSASGSPMTPARAAAYLLQHGQPTDRAIAMAETDADGRYRLLLPPAVTVWVLAAATRPRPSWIAVDPFAQPILGLLANDHLPTATTATSPDDGERELADLVLAAPAAVSGSLRWADGQPIEDAEVAIRPADGVPFSIGNRSVVLRQADGRLAPSTAVWSSDDGSFSLPAQAGNAVSILLDKVPQVYLHGSLRRHAVIAPHTLAIALPRPITLRVHHGGRPSRATIEFDGAERVDTDDDGVLQLVTGAKLSVRASHQRLRSPVQVVSPTATGTTIELELTAARQPLLLQLEGAEPLLTAVVTWRRDDDATGSEVLRRHDAQEPLQVFLEPGRYRLTIAAGSYGAGEWLLPLEREVTIAAAPVVLTAAARLGGTFTVTATDSSGRHVRGTCRVSDREGNDRTDRFRVRSSSGTQTGAPGELLDHGTNEFVTVLPPGDHELRLDFEQHGAQQRTVTIRPGAVSDVHVRLP
ncbi:MAG: hypothetical protein MUC36_11455 [Planctomycetes bacterium]|jgi:hypothetical protein|nr:hypothetical protein [Planctomycetota bacterium]